MRARQQLLRVDSESRRQKIEKARRLIFDGVNVTSQKIQDILGQDALVPTQVCPYLFSVQVLLILV